MSNNNFAGCKRPLVLIGFILLAGLLASLLFTWVLSQSTLFSKAGEYSIGSNSTRLPSSSVGELTIDQARAIKSIPPSDVTATLTPSGVKVSWLPSGGDVYSYRVYRRMGIGRFKQIAVQAREDKVESANGGRYELLDSRVGFGGVYTYALTVIDNLKTESDRSDTVTVINL